VGVWLVLCYDLFFLSEYQLCFLSVYVDCLFSIHGFSSEKKEFSFTSLWAGAVDQMRATERTGNSQKMIGSK
jgi:hypothetical protein